MYAMERLMKGPTNSRSGVLRLQVGRQRGLVAASVEGDSMFMQTANLTHVLRRHGYTAH